MIGVDVGTTRIKAGLIDSGGHEIVQTQVPTTWRRDDVGTEARPHDFTLGVERACAELLALAPPGEVAAIGITSMAETVVLIGPDGDAVGPAVAWHDRRAEVEFEDMKSALTMATIRRETGLNGDPIPTIATLRHLMGTMPELRRATSVLSVAEWIAYGLSGTVASELSLASRTGALSIERGEWWSEVIDWAGLEPRLFGELRPAGSSWGRVVDVERPGLERLVGATVTVAGHDHLAAAVGSGITGPDQIMDSCGTAEALVRAISGDQRLDPLIDIPEEIAIGWHVLPDCYCLLAGVPLGIELTPILAELGASQSRGETSLDEEALRMLAGELASAGRSGRSGRSGLSDLSDPTDRTDPTGLTGPTDPTDPAQVWLSSVKRAVARAAGRRAEIERLGGPITEVRISGGWAQNPVFRRVKELDFAALVYPAVVEAGVRGSGLMAGLAAGVFDSVDSFPAAPVRGDDLNASKSFQTIDSTT